MTNFIIDHQWQLFIITEVFTTITLILFLIIRYAIKKFKRSLWFLLLFLIATIFEGYLAWVVYRVTGHIGTFQVIIALFILYAFTFGIADFRKLDRFIKSNLGKWRGNELLTEKDKKIIEMEKDPAYVARKNRRWWYVHLVVITCTLSVFWIYFGNHSEGLAYYLTDLSWWGEDSTHNSPFTEQIILQISRVWMLVFAVDTIWSLSYTFFPAKQKD